MRGVLWGLAAWAVGAIAGAKALPTVIYHADRLLRPEDTVMMIVAARELPAGIPIDEEDLYAVQIPTRWVPEGAYDSPESVIGRVVTDTLLANDVVRVARTGSAASAPLSAAGEVRLARAPCAGGDSRACADLRIAMAQVLDTGTAAELELSVFPVDDVAASRVGEASAARTQPPTARCGASCWRSWITLNTRWCGPERRTGTWDPTRVRAAVASLGEPSASRVVERAVASGRCPRPRDLSRADLPWVLDAMGVHSVLDRGGSNGSARAHGQ